MPLLDEQFRAGRADGGAGVVNAPRLALRSQKGGVVNGIQQPVVEVVGEPPREDAERLSRLQDVQLVELSLKGACVNGLRRHQDDVPVSLFLVVFRLVSDVVRPVDCAGILEPVERRGEEPFGVVADRTNEPLCLHASPPFQNWLPLQG